MAADAIILSSCSSQVPFAGTPGVSPGLLDVHCADMHWIPSASKQMQQGSDVFAVGCTDGKPFDLSPS